MNKKAYYKCIGLLLVICIGLSVGLGIFMHIKLANRHYDSTTGPRGSAPGVSTASPLPIFNVTDSNSTLVYLGVTLDWSKDDPEHFNIDLGRTTSIQDVVFFMNDTFSNVGFANSSGYIHKEDNLIQWTAALIRGTGAIMGITIIPKIRMGLINSTAFLDIAEKCKMVNQMGIPVLLRFGPEMNGNWFAYGQNPAEYKQAFRDLTIQVRNQTNNTAMVWSPFSGTEYPYNWSPLTPYAGQARFLEVDTNKDGKLDGQDDPFSPYYPGDSYVDWVGMSIFYPGKEFITPLSHDQFQMDVKPTTTSTATAAPTSTSIPQIPKFQQQISASNNFESQLTNAGKPFNFYQMFAVSKSKPFLISSGAAYLQGPDVEPEPLELPFKSSWITQILNRAILEKYPWIKGLLFYNAVINVSETNYNGWFKFDSRTTVDYTLTRNASVLGFMRNRIDNLTLGNSDLLNHD